jgi:hypothetical protein
MTTRRIVARLLVTVALIGTPLVAIRSSAGPGASGSASEGLQVAQGGGPGMTGSTGGGNSNAGTAMGPDDDSPTAPDAAAPARPDGTLGTSKGDTTATGRESHSGASGAMRPEPTRTP